MAEGVARAEALLAEGDPVAALAVLKKLVRSSAADPALRVFLFQLLAVVGDWQRSLEQLDLCGRLDAGMLAMVSTYGPALRCEAAREAVFAGRTLPHVFGAPQAWLALLAQALQLDAQGQGGQATALRTSAFEQAPARGGTLDGVPFAWVADADSRLGPVLEVVINGRYGWLPFTELSRLDIEPATDLRDLVWAPAHLRLTNGGDTVALVPVRYAGTPQVDNGALLLARRTEWLPLGGEHYRGVGQRVLATDSTEVALLDARQLAFDAGPAAAAG